LKLVFWASAAFLLLVSNAVADDYALNDRMVKPASVIENLNALTKEKLVSEEFISSAYRYFKPTPVWGKGTLSNLLEEQCPYNFESGYGIIDGPEKEGFTKLIKQLFPNAVKPDGKIDFKTKVQADQPQNSTLIPFCFRPAKRAIVKVTGLTVFGSARNSYYNVENIENKYTDLSDFNLIDNPYPLNTSCYTHLVNEIYSLSSSKLAKDRYIQVREKYSDQECDRTIEHIVPNKPGYIIVRVPYFKRAEKNNNISDSTLNKFKKVILDLNQDDNVVLSSSREVCNSNDLFDPLKLSEVKYINENLGRRTDVRSELVVVDSGLFTLPVDIFGSEVTKVLDNKFPLFGLNRGHTDTNFYNYERGLHGTSVSIVAAGGLDYIQHFNSKIDTSVSFEWAGQGGLKDEKIIKIISNAVEDHSPTDPKIYNFSQEYSGNNITETTYEIVNPKDNPRAVLFVFAAGNNHSELDHADAEKVLSAHVQDRYTVVVGATDEKGGISIYSNHGEGVDIYAPGCQKTVGVSYKAVPNISDHPSIVKPFLEMKNTNGTSIAAPYVSFAANTSAEEFFKYGSLLDGGQLKSRIIASSGLSVVDAQPILSVDVIDASAWGVDVINEKPCPERLFERLREKLLPVSTPLTAPSTIEEVDKLYADLRTAYENGDIKEALNKLRSIENNIDLLKISSPQCSGKLLKPEKRFGKTLGIFKVENLSSLNPQGGFLDSEASFSKDISTKFLEQLNLSIDKLDPFKVGNSEFLPIMKLRKDQTQRQDTWQAPRVDICGVQDRKVASFHITTEGVYSLEPKKEEYIIKNLSNGVCEGYSITIDKNAITPDTEKALFDQYKSTLLIYHPIVNGKVSQEIHYLPIDHVRSIKLYYPQALK